MNKGVREEWREKRRGRRRTEEERGRTAGVGSREGVRGEPDGGRGETELRGILKTFAILLIFFLKWVKLFYDFRRSLSLG